jgi:hypothetical protein
MVSGIVVNDHEVTIDPGSFDAGQRVQRPPQHVRPIIGRYQSGYPWQGVCRGQGVGLLEVGRMLLLLRQKQNSIHDRWTDDLHRL